MWNDKRYYSIDYYLKQTFGEKVYRLALNGGMTCPNRDGTLGRRGCIFCSSAGSGDFAQQSGKPIASQIAAAHGGTLGFARRKSGGYDGVLELPVEEPEINLREKAAHKL